jgi:hypothetical protein
MLRQAREAKGLGVRAGAEVIEKSGPSLSRLEAGMVPVRGLEVRALCNAYGIEGDRTDFMVSLAQQTQAPADGWWAEFGDAVPDDFRLFVGLEAAARRIDTYETELVPGLFQNEDYARALISASRTGESPEEIGQRVRLRLSRQQILSRQVDPPDVRVILREAILRTPIGGGAVMAAQLSHLADTATRPNVKIRIVPFAKGFHPGLLSGPFTALSFTPNGTAGNQLPSTVYSDLYRGSLYMDKPEEVTRYSQAFDLIWKTALDEEESGTALREASEEMMRHGR